LENKVSKLSSLELKATQTITGEAELVCADNNGKKSECIVISATDLQAIIADLKATTEQIAEKAAEKAVAKYRNEAKSNENESLNDKELTMSEVAAYLGASVWWVSRHCHCKHVGQRNVIPHRRKGRKYIFYQSQIDKWNSDRRDG